MRASTLRVHAILRESVKGDTQQQTRTAELAVFDNTALNIGWSHFTCAYGVTLPFDQLKRSLAGVLHLFPTFTGRLVNTQGGGGRYAVLCNNAGADWLYGTSPNTLDALQPPAAGDARAWMLPDTTPFVGARVVDLLPQLYAGRDWALMRASVVHLADGATAITVSMCHVLGDFSSMRQLLRHWSAAFSGATCPELPLPYERTLVESLATDDLPDGYSPQMLIPRPPLVQLRFGASVAKNWFLLGGGVTGMVSFCVSAERLRELKAEATAGLAALGPKAADQWVSSNDALVARLWQVLSRLPMRQGARFAPAISMDARGRMGIPGNSVGNFAFWALPDACDAAACSLGELAMSVRTAIHGTPAMAVKDLAWALPRAPSALWGSAYVPSTAGVTSNTGAITYTNWSIEDEDATFGGATPAACLPHTQMLAHHCVVWGEPQQAGMQVVSITLTRKEADQLLMMIPGGL